MGSIHDALLTIWWPILFVVSSHILLDGRDDCYDAEPGDRGASLRVAWRQAGAARVCRACDLLVSDTFVARTAAVRAITTDGESDGASSDVGPWPTGVDRRLLRLGFFAAGRPGVLRLLGAGAAWTRAAGARPRLKVAMCPDVIFGRAYAARGTSREHVPECARSN